jgi:hypothetical protein
MNVRELLRREIWSKRATRKILVGFGIAFWIVTIGLGALFVVERSWVTPGERRTGRDALMQIEALRNSGSISDEDFDLRDKQVRGRIEVAEKAARTYRDARIADSLDFYLGETETVRMNIKMRNLREQRNLPIKQSQRELEEKISLMETQVTQFLRSELHKALD